MIAHDMKSETDPRYFIKGLAELIGSFPSNQNTLYLLCLFYSDNEIITVCCRPEICTLIGWIETSRLCLSFSKVSLQNHVVWNARPEYSRKCYSSVTKNITLLKTRTTNVVRNAGCARSRYILKLSLIFLINQWINQLINRVYLEWLIRH